MHDAEISVASIPVEERKVEVVSKSKKHKLQLEDLPAGVKQHSIHHTKKAKSDDEGETILPGKKCNQKEEKNDFYTNSNFVLWLIIFVKS